MVLVFLFIEPRDKGKIDHTNTFCFPPTFCPILNLQRLTYGGRLFAVLASLRNILALPQLSSCFIDRRCQKPMASKSQAVRVRPAKILPRSGSIMAHLHNWWCKRPVYYSNSLEILIAPTAHLRL